MLYLLFLLTALTRLCCSENILSRLRDDVFYQYDAEVIPQEVSGGRLECLLTVYLLRTGRTASLLMSTWVWLPPGWTWTATVEILFYFLIFLLLKTPPRGLVSRHVAENVVARPQTGLGSSALLWYQHPQVRSGQARPHCSVTVFIIQSLP